MNSFNHRESVEKIHTVFASVFKKKIKKIEKLSGGKNSITYKVSLNESDNKNVVFKAYFSHEDDKRDRLLTEFNTLEFLFKNKVDCVPKPIHLCADDNYGIYEWIQGETLQVQQIGAKEVNLAVDFLTQLNDLTKKEEAKGLNNASEACFSLNSVEKTVEYRIVRLEECDNSELQTFLQTQIRPFFKDIITWGKTEGERLNIGWEQEIQLRFRTLSPSDFGFHNAICGIDGILYFIDFEYFGWDDPAKMICDFLLHPAFQLSADLKSHFVKKVVSNLSLDRQLIYRAHLSFPMHGINWCLRMLNEFLPEHGSRREFALGIESGFDAIKMDQLKKAKNLYHTINSFFPHFPYD